MSEKNGTKEKTVRVGGLVFPAESRERVFSAIAERLKRGEKTTVFTPNAAMAGAALEDPALLALLRRADILLPDGVGVVLAARRAGKAVERMPGIEMGEKILETAAMTGRGVFFLGGKPGVAARAAGRFPAVTGWHDGFFAEGEIPAVLEKIRVSGAAAVFVCMGFPRQERFILRARDVLPAVTLWMGLGGSLDVWAGDAERAPGWVQKMGMEWLWRMKKDKTGEKRRRIPAMMRYIRKANCKNDG